MLSNVMKYDFLVKLDAIPNLKAPGYDDREISYFLNVGQDRVTLDNYLPLSNKYGVGFEGNEKRKRDLAELVTSTYILGYDSSDAAIYTGDIKYLNCTTSIETGEGALERKVTIGEIDKTYDISGISLPLTAGLYKGQTITFDADGGGPITTTIVDILSGTEIYVQDDLATLTTNIYFTGGTGLSINQFGVHQNGFFMDLPDLFLYSIEEQVITSELNTKFVTVKPVEHDYVDANLLNPYRKPYKNVIWRLNVASSIKGYGDEDGTLDVGTSVLQRKKSNKRVELITNGSNPSVYFLRYLKYPRRIVVDEDTEANQISCELDESLHNTVVDEAVKAAVATFKPQEYQIKVAEKESNE